MQESANNANGLTRDLQGRMILCEGGVGRVTRMEPDGSITVVANSYQGMPLNRPNDVVVRSSDGGIHQITRRCNAGSLAGKPLAGLCAT